MRVFKITILIIIFAFALAMYPSYLLYNSIAYDGALKSPLPEFLTKKLPQALGMYEIWRPDINNKIVSDIDEPDITAKSAISYDLTTNTLLYEKDIDKKLPMASLTKVATAIVALERSDPGKIYTVSKNAAEIGENSMGLSIGEKISLEELLYGLILVSGNDAGEVIAEGSRFGRENFIYLMNKKVENLGLSNTRFTNPTGLEGDGKQYSTAYDLLVITKHALENPTFAEISSTVNHEIPASGDHKAFFMYNETNLLTSYFGVKGVKTGYTFEAGLCLVTYLEHEDHKIIAVLLNAENRREEMKDLLDYSLLSLGVNPPEHN